MRLVVLFVMLLSVSNFGTYYYGYNTGDKETSEFIKNIIVPFCDIVSNDNLSLVNCIRGNIL